MGQVKSLEVIFDISLHADVCNRLFSFLLPQDKVDSITALYKGVIQDLMTHHDQQLATIRQEMIDSKNTQAALVHEVVRLRENQISKMHNHGYISISKKLEELGKFQSTILSGRASIESLESLISAAEEIQDSEGEDARTQNGEGQSEKTKNGEGKRTQGVGKKIRDHKSDDPDHEGEKTEEGQNKENRYESDDSSSHQSVWEDAQESLSCHGDVDSNGRVILHATSEAVKTYSTIY